MALTKGERINMDIEKRSDSIRTDFRKCRRLLIAIGDATRQTIIAVLAEADCHIGMRVGEITDKTHLSRPAVSHHLKILLDEEVIGVMPKGTMNFYYLKLGGEWTSLVALINHIEQLRKDEAGGVI
jgi:ArsR family transcriptional regulator